MRTVRTKRTASRSEAKAKAAATHDRYVVRVYGLAPGQYALILDQQDGRCALCRRIPRRRRLAVDHDHDTGRVRGLLCYLCNKYLGQWESDPIAAHSASQYLAEIAEEYFLRHPLVATSSTEGG